MKTIYRILLPALMVCSAILAGCTEQFDTPPVREAVTDADITGEGYKIVSIRSVKKIFEKAYPDYTSGSVSFNKDVKIDEKSLEAAGMDKNSLIAIKGRVISTDYFGNVYRTIYLLDASDLPEGEEPEVIEVKIGLSGMFADYQPGDILYVKTNGLVIGNYRFNLSLGSVFQALEGANVYANGYIDLKSEIIDRVKQGKKNSELPSIDTLVFNASNIPDYLNVDIRDASPAQMAAIASITGRLVRFEGMTSVLGTAEPGTPGYSNTDIYPSFLEQIGSGVHAVYQNYLFMDVINEWKAYDSGESDVMPASPRPGKMFPTWAFNGVLENGLKASYYGSALFSVGPAHFVVRSSGYSNFSLEALPFEYEISGDGNVTVKGNKDVDSITGIITRYASSSGGYHKFQILLNSSRDVVYDRSGNPR